MNILYHHRTQETGVEGVHIREIVNALKILGHRVDIISPHGINQEAKSNKSKVGFFRVLSGFLPEILFELMEILYNVVSYKELKILLKSKNYDFIYERYAIFNWTGVKAAKKFGVPIILEVNYTSYTSLYRRRTKILEPLAHFLDKKIFEKADGIVVVSTYLKRHLTGLGVDERKIIVLTNAADISKFNFNINCNRIKEKYKLNGRKVIGFVGGFYPWHGLDILTESFMEVKNQLKEVCLFLIGDGPLKNEIEGKIKESGLERDVQFAGTIDHTDLPDYIAAFDIAVMPDSNEYGSPMKIYEYMAMGKPVIAPRLGPLEDGIDDGKEGILFEQHNGNELTKAMMKVLTNDGLCKEMGRNGANRVCLRHTWGKNVEGILKLYEKIHSRVY
jgi:glycosyltransferase involved in cell wall biosynthesis